MKLSIITVNLNNRAGLQKTIESIITQTFKDYEWIVIDGGSIDGSKELIEHYSDYISYWVSEPDKGIYNAMNKGILMAKGDYILFINSGDWLCNDTALERCLSHGLSADIAYGELYFVDNDGNYVKSRFPKQVSVYYLYHYSLGHNASFIKRTLLQNEPYDEQYSIVSDWAFFLKQALNGRHFEYLDEVVSCFDTTGISSTQSSLVSEERQHVINSLIPETLLYDFNQMDDMRTKLNKDHVKRVLTYGEKKKIYHKIITGFLLFIGVLDRVSKQ